MDKVSRTRLPHIVIVKAPGLLNMEYSPSELAKDLKVPINELYDWLNESAPYSFDSEGRVWVNGIKFKQWVNGQRNIKASSRKLQNNEAYCSSCKAVVKFNSYQIVQGRGKLIYIHGECPTCGNKINRGGRDV